VKGLAHEEAVCAPASVARRARQLLHNLRFIDRARFHGTGDAQPMLLCALPALGRSGRARFDSIRPRADTTFPSA